MNTSNNSAKLSVEYRGVEGRSPRFAALKSNELSESLRERFTGWDVVHRAYISNTKKAIAFGGGTRSYIQLTGPMLLLANGEQTRARITVYDQDYSGKALRVEYGLYRLVCTNGLMGWGSVAEPIRIPHHKNRTDMLMQLDQIITNSASVFTKIVDDANRLLATNFRGHWALVLDEAATIVGLPKKTVEKVRALIVLGKNRVEDKPDTIWGLYNIINEVERVTARKNSVLYMQRDNQLLDAIKLVA